MKLLVQNSKLKKTSKLNGIQVFNFGIPAAKTCAQICKGCYALQGAYIWPQVKAAYEARYQASLRPDFVSVMTLEIEKKLKKGRVAVRIHDAGDFYSLEYLNKWIMIANLNPSVLFYAYTKNIGMFKNRDLPENFKIIFSMGGRQEKMIDQNLDRHARVFENEADLISEGYINGTDDDLIAPLATNNKIGLVYHGQKKFENSSFSKKKGGDLVQIAAQMGNLEIIRVG